MRRLITAFTVAAVLVWAGLVGGVSAASFPGVIPIAGATSAEGIAIGVGSTFYAGDLFKGDIYRGDLRSGKVSMFIDAPDGRQALGMKADIRRGLLFVAGGFTGQAYIYNLHTGADVAVFQLGVAPNSIINDVVVTRGAAWFTDSAQPKLYRVPIHHDGSVGRPSTLVVTGPAAHLTGAFNMNGIAATPNGKTLIVAHSGDGALYTVNPKTGASAAIAGATVPNVDGILFEAGRLWAVQNFSNQVTEFRLSHDLSSATVIRVIHNSDVDNAFEIPTTAARHGNQIAVVNAKFDTGFPPTAASFEVVVFNGR